MQVVSNKREIIFRNEYEGKPIYKIGISHKNQDGTYTNSTMLCRLPKGTDLHHKTYIKIKQAWLDFYTVKKEKNGKQYDEAVPYVFINDYEIDTGEETNVYTVDSFTTEDLDNSTPDLPF